MLLWLLRGSSVVILVGIRGAMNENEIVIIDVVIIIIIRISTVVVLHLHLLLLLSHSTTTSHFVPSWQGMKPKLVVGMAGKHGPCLRGRDNIHDYLDTWRIIIYNLELVRVCRVDITHASPFSISGSTKCVVVSTRRNSSDRTCRDGRKVTFFSNKDMSSRTDIFA